MKPALATRKPIEQMSALERAALVCLLDAEADVYGDDFAIVRAPKGNGCAIIDLKSKCLCWAAFRVRSEEALCKLAEPGATGTEPTSSRFTSMA